MASANKVRSGDADTYEATVVIEGGLLVVPAAGATISGVQGIAVAGDAATNVLGVTAQRAEPAANQDLTGTDSDGYPFTNVNTVDELTTVYKHAVVSVTYTAAAVGFGAKLAAAANGAVRAFVAGTDPSDAVVGECRVIGGMGSGGGAGLALIY
jgi:hypothetical protein